MGLVPIEKIQPDDWVYGHDCQPYRVLQIIDRRHAGTMIGLGHPGAPVLWLTAEHLVLSRRRVTALTPDGGWTGIPAHHVEYARQQRKNGSPPEGMLWSRLRNKQLGVKFRRQHQLGPYIADFYSRPVGLVVEVDGKTHDSPEAMAYDRVRDEWMTSFGLTVRRFSAHEVGGNLDGVIEVIRAECRQQVLVDDPAKQWIVADRVTVGDVVYCGVGQEPSRVTTIERMETIEPVYALEVEHARSFVTATCAVHFGGFSAKAAPP